MKEVQRVSSGIAEFDRMLGGGFRKNSLNLISGCSGAGKTLFTLTFLYDGACKNEKAVYLTLEEEAEQVIADCQSIGIDLTEYEEQLQILDVAKLRRQYSNHEELAGTSSLLDVDILLDLIRRNCKGADRLVIDSVVPLSMKYPNVNEFRASLFRLTSVLKEMSMTVIFTTEVPTSTPDVISRFKIEDFLADSVTVLKQGKEDKISSRYIRVHKIRGSNHTKTFVEYHITSQGIKILYPVI